MAILMDNFLSFIISIIYYVCSTIIGEKSKSLFRLLSPKRTRNKIRPNSKFFSFPLGLTVTMVIGYWLIICSRISTYTYSLNTRLIHNFYSYKISKKSRPTLNLTLVDNSVHKKIFDILQYYM